MLVVLGLYGNSYCSLKYYSYSAAIGMLVMAFVLLLFLHPHRLSDPKRNAIGVCIYRDAPLGICEHSCRCHNSNAICSSYAYL